MMKKNIVRPTYMLYDMDTNLSPCESSAKGLDSCLFS